MKKAHDSNKQDSFVSPRLSTVYTGYFLRQHANWK